MNTDRDTKRMSSNDIEEKFWQIISSPRRWEHSETAAAVSSLEKWILESSVEEVQRTLIRDIGSTSMVNCMHGLGDAACRKIVDNASKRYRLVLMRELCESANPEEAVVCQEVQQVLEWIAGQGTITIHRGTCQIGGCATEIVCGENRIIIDLGANLPGTEPGRGCSDEELVKKVFDGRKCDGVLFTHYHGDHYGLYTKVPEGIPMYMGRTAIKILKIITERVDYIQEEKGLPVIEKMEPYFIRRWMNFGKIKVRPLVTDHSALDAYMLLIKAGNKKILFTGDFREHGVAGETNSFEKMIREYVGNVDILITEGTLLSRLEEVKNNPIRTEADLGKQAAEIFRQNKENVVLVSSTNLDSIMEFYHAVPDGMEFVCDAYQAKIILAAMEDKGTYYTKYRLAKNGKMLRKFHIVGDMEGLGEGQHCVAADFRNHLRHTGFVMLARANRNPKKDENRFEKILKCMQDPMIIYSMWKGYIEENGKHADRDILKFIGNHRMEQLHTSGHACVETIAKLIRMTQPVVIIPMHTECAEVMKELPVFEDYAERIEPLLDGQSYRL